MSDTTPGSWQPDPYGRFAQRYWDGTAWTATVADAAGTQYTDAPVPSPATPQGYATSGYTAPATAAATSPPVPGLVVAGIGALCVILSDFVLNWFSAFGQDIKLSDLRDVADNPNVPFFSEQYLKWGWLLGLAAVGFGIAALFVANLRLPAAIALVVVAAWHGWTAYDASTSAISPDIGAWLGSIGFVAGAVALFLPRPAATR